MIQFLLIIVYYMDIKKTKNKKINKKQKKQKQTNKQTNKQIKKAIQTVSDLETPVQCISY